MASPAWRQGLELGGVVARTVGHFWPDLTAWLDALRDPRDPNRTVYPARCLTWTGLLVFLLKLGSRRQIRFELDSPTALENLNRLAGCRQDRVPHGDTLNYFLGRLAPGELAGLRRRRVNRLIRMKALDGGRLLGHFLAVIDGTGQLYFRRRHCPHCLERTVGGQTQYFHHVLEAKLVTPEGLAISIGTEFIENADPKASKQDCELKAFANPPEPFLAPPAADVPGRGPARSPTPRGHPAAPRPPAPYPYHHPTPRPLRRTLPRGSSPLAGPEQGCLGPVPRL